MIWPIPFLPVFLTTPPQFAQQSGKLVIKTRGVMNKRDWGIEDPEETYWFNVKTGEVEEGKLSLSIDRLGPFETKEDAARAPEILAERARRWAEEEAAED